MKYWFVSYQYIKGKNIGFGSFCCDNAGNGDVFTAAKQLKKQENFESFVIVSIKELTQSEFINAKNYND